MTTSTEKKYLDIKDIAKSIRQQLKTEFPLCVFSIEIERYSMGQTLNIQLMSTPFEVFNKGHKEDMNGKVYDERDYQYRQLNHYRAIQDFGDGYNNGSYLTQEAWKVLKRALEITHQFHYDNSDSQTDYFDTNFYIHLAIGKWNKPFQKQ